MRVSVPDLVALATGLLESAGVPAEDARVTADRLVGADGRGRTGHGLVRLVPYLDRIRAGGINVRPDVRVLVDRPSTAQLDGDNGLGQVVMTRATDLAIGKAAVTGIGVVGTVRSNHAGAAGLYALRAAEAGMVGIYLAVANANGLPPWGGSNPLLGTNPLAIAVPSAGSPFVLDIATTAASHGTIKTTRAAGLPMPEGWVVDREGRPITDPARADEGFLVPMGGYKGAGLTIAIGLLAGVLNGAAFGSSVVDQRVDLTTPTNTGQLRRGPRGRRVPPAGRGARGRRGGAGRAPRVRRPGGASAPVARRRLGRALDRVGALGRRRASPAVGGPGR